MRNEIKSFLRDIYRKMLYFLPVKVCLNIDVLRGYQKLVNFKDPKYFGEKIQWLKLNGNLERYTDLVDKYIVRDYIKEKIGSKYLINLLGVYDKPEEIDYEALPQSFVLKINTGSGYNIVVKNKNNLDYNATNKKLNKWLKEDYARIKKEPQYKNVKKKIICEEYISDLKGELLDYKFFCFNGEPKFLKVDSDRYSTHKVNFYDMNWNLLDMKEGKFPNNLKNCKKPSNFNEMVDIAKKLCADFNFVRVDLYNIDGKIYFGELTFTPASGLNPFKPLEKDLEIAKLIHINNSKKVLYIGSVGEKSGRLDGVTIKSKSLLDYLRNQNIELKFVDVDNYKRRFATIIFDILKYYRNSNSIIICSSSPGASIILRFLYWINCKKNIYYFVCGGVLDKWIKNGKYPLKWYKNITKIYVESEEMKVSFNNLGLSQVSKLENFRKPKVHFNSPSINDDIFKFVFFGRVIPGKGVEESINLIKKLNNNGYRVILDIYGQISPEYRKYIEDLIKDSEYIKYKGSIKPDSVMEYKTLHEYDIFLFPTKYYEEGLPGALIDAYISGLAVIAADWKYAKEYISDEKNGYIFEFENYDDMYKQTIKLMESNKLYDFKLKSLELSHNYVIDYLLKDFIELILK